MIPARRHVACQPVVNLFAEPSLAAEVTSQVLYGTPVTLLEDAGDWWLAGTADGYRGFARQQDFLPWASEAGSVEARVDQLSANLYRTPDVKAGAPLLNLPWEARLAVLLPAVLRPEKTDMGDEARWLPVRLLDGSSAYVQRGDIRFDTTPCSLDRMLALAHRFLGITYTWGGTSTYGYDCSGFVQMLFRQAGIVIPRDAQAQSDWHGFEPVERSELEPADVLFFGDSPGEIMHVGLHLEDGKFIHDTTETHPCIQISRLDDAPWSERLTTCRRLRP